MNLDNILDSTKDFYYVDYEERDGKRTLIVYPLGYIYCSGSSIVDGNPDKIYRWNEYSGIDFTLKKLWQCNYDPDEDEDFQCRNGDRIEDLTHAEACEKLLELMCEMENEKHCVPYDALENDVPAGLYYNGDGLIW